LRFNLRILQSAAIAATLLMAIGATAATGSGKHTKTSCKTHSSFKSGKSSNKSSNHKSASAKSGKKGRSSKSASKGQSGIDSERTTQIQQALIREHYLSGEPTGKWDQSTKDALVKFQEDNGWQTKSVPDSRALIKLGLGPDKKGLLNPDTAAMMTPHELGASNDAQPGGAAQQ